MAFTSKLGSGQLGSIELGFVGTASGNYDNSLSIDGISAARPNVSDYLALAVGGLAAFAASDSAPFQLTLTVGGLSAATPLPGTGYFATRTVDGLSGAATASRYGVNASLSVDAAAAFAESGGYGKVLTVSGVSDLSASMLLTMHFAETVAGTAAFDSPGGVVYFLQRSIEGLSAAVPTPGIGYFTTLSIDGTSDSGVPVNEYFKNGVLSIDGAAAADASVTYVGNPPLAVSGASACGIADSVSSVNFATFTASASVNVENIYDILLGTGAFAALDAVGVAFKASSEQPSSQGSFSATCTGVFNRTVVQGLLLTQFATYRRPTGLVGQLFAISQVVAVRAVHLQSVSSSLAMTQDAEACRPGASTLAIAQSATCVKVKLITVSQTLALAQSPSRIAALARPVSQTLAFNVVRQVIAPIIGSSGGGGQTQFQYNQPLVSVALRPRNCLVILGTPTQSIVLPCPLFGDTQAYTGQMDLKKTMTGDTYTYVKKTATETVKYSFNLGTYKAIELRSFLLGHSQELITMHNWKGETWYVFLTNNPFEFTHAARWQPRGERVDITLEFEGIRR